MAWGSLDAWQMGLWARLQRIEYLGTQTRDDLTLYLADRYAATGVGDQGVPLTVFPEVFVKQRDNLPRLQPLLDHVPMVSIIVLAATVLCVSSIGAWAAIASQHRRWHAAFGESRIASNIALSQRRTTLFCNAVSVGCLSAFPFAAFVWYCFFDRSCDAWNVQHALVIGLWPTLALLALTLATSIDAGLIAWNKAMRNAPAREGAAGLQACGRCMYPRVGNVAGVCPECGMAWGTPKDAGTFLAWARWPIARALSPLVSASLLLLCVWPIVRKLS